MPLGESRRRLGWLRIHCATMKSVGEAMPEDVSNQQGWRPARHVVDPVSAKVPTRPVTINLNQDLVAI